MTVYGVVYRRANVSPTAPNGRRAPRPYVAPHKYIPSGTADLWRSARRFGR
jgi:hypothetical protein